MTDPFRTQYRQLNADEAHAIARIKALAKTNLQQAVMWATLSVTG